MTASELYKEKIIDHYKNPRNFKKLKRPDYEFKAANSVCGDEIAVYLKEKKGKISEVGFQGSGCAISLAGMSILSEKLEGMTKEEVESISNEEMLGMLGVDPKSPRVKCATLGLSAVVRALNKEEDDPCEFC
jgi:nitrogen fixation protein NifU and related proteins